MNSSRVVAFTCLAILSLPLALLAQAQTAVPVAEAGGVPLAASTAQSLTEAGSPELYRRFIGQWSGTLAYRDYSDAANADSGKRVTLPTTLEVTLSPQGGAMIFHYTYDDGPGKIVQENETVWMNATQSRYLEVNADGKERSEYHATGFSGLQGDAPAHVVLEGKGEENSKPVVVRTTLDISYRTFTILRETKLAGKDFLFRHQYKFERLAAAKSVQ